MADTDQQRKAHIQALLRERAGYVARGLADRVAQVDEQLAHLGAQGAAPAARAVRRSTRKTDA